MIAYGGGIFRPTANISSAAIDVRRQWISIFKVLRENCKSTSINFYNQINHHLEVRVENSQIVLTVCLIQTVVQNMMVQQQRRVWCNQTRANSRYMAGPHWVSKACPTVWPLLLKNLLCSMWLALFPRMPTPERTRPGSPEWGWFGTEASCQTWKHGSRDCGHVSSHAGLRPWDKEPSHQHQGPFQLPPLSQRNPELLAGTHWVGMRCSLTGLHLAKGSFRFWPRRLTRFRLALLLSVCN